MAEAFLFFKSSPPLGLGSTALPNPFFPKRVLRFGPFRSVLLVFGGLFSYFRGIPLIVGRSPGPCPTVVGDSARLPTSPRPNIEQSRVKLTST